MHLDVGRVRGIEQRPVEHAHPSVALRDLQGVDAFREPLEQHPAHNGNVGAHPQRRHEFLPGRTAYRSAEAREHRPPALLRERRHPHPIVRSVLLDARDEWLDRPGSLDVDVDAQLRVTREQIVEAGDRLDAVDASLRDHRPRELRDDAAGIRRPVERLVVEREQHPVGGGVHVGLHPAIPERRGRVERRHRVLEGVIVAARETSVGQCFGECV